jgi:molybdopterin converting factor subunit 1
MQPALQVVVHLFAAARDLAGADSVTVALAPGPVSPTVADLRARLIHDYPRLSRLLSVSAVAVNHDFAEDDRVLTPSDEVAVIPPVSGG